MLLSLRAIQYLQTGSTPEVKPQQMMGEDEDAQNGDKETLAGEPSRQSSPLVTGSLPGESRGRKESRKKTH